MKKVLVVEDEVVVAVAVRLTLESSGYETTLAADGLEGLARAEADPPDVILTDYMMPRMDGLEMLQAMRDGGSDAPAILMTSVPEKLLPDGAGNLYQAYLAKPFHDETLIALIHKLLRLNDGA